MTANTIETCDHMLCTVAVSPDEVDAGATLAVKVSVSCPSGCDLRGRIISIRDQSDAELATAELAQMDGGTYAADEIMQKAPIKATRYAYRAVVIAHDKNGLSAEELSTTFVFHVKAHAVHASVWGLSSAITAGENFTFRVGIKCSNNCNLGGRAFRVLGQDGAEAATGMLGNRTAPGTDAVYFADVEALAPVSTGDYRWVVEAPGANSELPHQDGACTFAVRAVGQPDHQVTVRAFDAGMGIPVKGAHVLLHPYRAITNEGGIAVLKVTKGRYTMVISGFRYIPYETVVEADRDVGIRAELTVEPEQSPFYPQPPSAADSLLSEDDDDVPKP